jgi:hypothetical protein
VELSVRLGSLQTGASHHADWRFPPCRLALPTMQTGASHHADWRFPPCRLALPTMQTGDLVHVCAIKLHQIGLCGNYMLNYCVGQTCRELHNFACGGLQQMTFIPPNQKFCNFGNALYVHYCIMFIRRATRSPSPLRYIMPVIMIYQSPASPCVSSVFL